MEFRKIQCADEPSAGSDQAKLLQKVYTLLKVCVFLLSFLCMGVIFMVVSSLPASSTSRSDELVFATQAPVSMTPRVSGSASAEQKPLANVLVVSKSIKNHTRMLGMEVAAGAASVVGAHNVRVRDVADAHPSDVAWADAVLLGSPVYNGNVHPAMLDFIDAWPARGSRAILRGKVGGAFVTSDGMSAGGELVLQSLHTAMLVFGFVVAPGPAWNLALGAYSVKELGSVANEWNRPYYNENAKAYGAELARVAVKLKLAHM